MPIEYSNCADSRRSRVTAVQPNRRAIHVGLPMLIISSIVNHPRSGASARAADMDDLGRGTLADAVPAEIADHASDGVRHASGWRARRRPSCCRAWLLVPSIRHYSHVDQPLRLDRHVVADQVHPAGVAMPAVEQRRPVDDDVAVPTWRSDGMPWQTTWLIEMQLECV